MRFNIVKTLIGSLFLAVLLFWYIQPNETVIPSWLNFLIIILIQLTALVITQLLTPGTIRGIIIRALLVSALFSLLIVFVLQPSIDIGFYQTYLFVTILEFASILAAVVMIHPGSRQ